MGMTARQSLEIETAQPPNSKYAPSFRLYLASLSALLIDLLVEITKYALLSKPQHGFI
ncbi:MAG: hypothetical protein ACXWYD_19680 [Candidatus Binatia bacterium]